MSSLIRFLSNHDIEWFIGDDGLVRIVSHGVYSDGRVTTEVEAVSSVADARDVLGY